MVTEAPPFDLRRQSAMADEFELELARIDHGTAARNILIDPETGEGVEMSPMHWEWHALANQHKFLEIIAHRDSGKTEQMAIARTISELGRNPNLRVKIICESDDLAKSRVTAIGTHIEKSETVKRIWPHLKAAQKADWSKHRLMVERDHISKDGSVEAYGVLSAGVGGRGDVLIFDDVCGFINTLARPAQRTMVQTAINEQWLPMLGPRGRALYIATPWHRADATHAIEKNSEWHSVRYAVKDFKSPWIQRPPDFFQSRLRQMGARAYQRAYELKAMSDEEAIFTETMIQQASDPKINLGQMYPEDWPRVAGVDLAASLGAAGKWTVMFTSVWTPDGTRIPVDIVRAKQTFDDTIRMIVDSYRVHKHSLIKVENNGMQEMVLQHLGANYGHLPVEGFTTTSNKHHMTLGLPGFQIQLNNRNWIIPKGGCAEAYCECNVCVWEGEMLGHPVGDHSDILMAWWLCENAVRRLQDIVDITMRGPAVSLVKLNDSVGSEYEELDEDEMRFFNIDEQQPPSWLGSRSL